MCPSLTLQSVSRHDRPCPIRLRLEGQASCVELSLRSGWIMDPAVGCDFFGLGNINHIFWGIFKIVFNQTHNGIQCGGGKNNNTTVSTLAVQILFLIVWIILVWWPFTCRQKSPHFQSWFTLQHLWQQFPHFYIAFSWKGTIVKHRLIKKLFLRLLKSLFVGILSASYHELGK